MKILVVGAGIAGLAAARALTRAGQAVEVVERAAGPDRGGGGLYLPGNAVRALRRVGLGELDAEPDAPPGPDRGLPAPIRDAALRLAGERLYRADYRPLLGEPWRRPAAGVARRRPWRTARRGS